LHSSITGDLINVKYGKGFIDNCTFRGNSQPDTDAIDYDDVVNGVIKNCIIHDFHGLNSDAIDIGEQSQNVLIDSIFVYNITDKGVSVGQQSSATISNSIFTACNLGLGLKDSSRVSINHCTFYGNNIPVAVYEKNPGDAGANVRVSNSILSNSYESTVLCDEYSTLEVSYSLSDNDSLPQTGNNILGNPYFENPVEYRFGLSDASPAIAAANNGANLGIELPPVDAQPNLVIDRIFYSSGNRTDYPEFFSIYNPSSSRVDLSGMKITRGISFEFPEGTTIEAGESVYLTNNMLHSFWENRVKKLHQWQSGKLADEGEFILLETANGLLLDGLKFGIKPPWPELDNSPNGIVLKSFGVDNHFGSNWYSENVNTMVSSKMFHQKQLSLKAYPNPASETITVEGFVENESPLLVINTMGKIVLKQIRNENNYVLDISGLPNGLYHLQSGQQSVSFIIKH
jgi:hypothetical protein